MPIQKEIPDTEKTSEDWDALPNVVILQMGLVQMLVCAKDGTPPGEIERKANMEQPTGISTSWKIDGEVETMPCPDGRPNATHYALSC